ncbi:MAG: DUF1906 domain-containing protein [Rhizobacter sp.]|nr:DUF1906 domain-containing protein [Rhizobacter sp.]
MHEGLSTNRHCHGFADCLVREGKAFVFRYHSRTTLQPEKRISPKEAADLARAGLQVATVYQDNARKLSDFGFDRGRLDGASAQTFASQIGQPPGSAVYFAVDTDFSAAEIQQVVLPYFRGVKAGMDEAGGGTSPLKIGVYGSGLTCRLVRDTHALARFAWLAEATGWRESSTYTQWDVRQHVNRGQALCGLGAAWERCEARGEFGQFRPIGFDVVAGQGELKRVTATQLNLRHGPSAASNPPITTLPEGQLVRVLGEAAPPWVRVRVTLSGGDVVGYVSGKHLAAVAAPPVAPPRAPAVPAVHYRENDAASRRSSIGKRAQPLGEPGRPSRDAAASPAARATQLVQIVNWLAADTSTRYQRDPNATYCNVYATDYCYLSGVYLPRTWWNESALMQMARGQPVAPAYGSTLREMRADDLHRWLIEFGESFGWRRVFDLSALQNAANQGGIGLICADREENGKPGHITAVVPESSALKAKRDADGNVTLPLQSQAGAVNFRFSTVGKAWWESTLFQSHVFFVHD